ncbi:unnamed protein product [Rotaria sp. Silwood1]|nr:unnamed protein product [Rotaria sp. Silwood1]
MATNEGDDSETKIKEQKKEEQGSCGTYPPIIGLNCNHFQLSDTSLPEACRCAALQQLKNYLHQQQENFLGYQVNQDVCYSKDLSFMLDIHTNNIGDPFENGNCTVNTKIMERAVLDHFANLWHAKTPSISEDKESYWGYVLSMGSTEGNLYALYNARDYLKGKALYREQNGDLSYVRPKKENVSPNDDPKNSQDTHYSITKIVRALEIRTFYEIGEKEYKGQCPITPDGQWPKEVPSECGNEGPGSIDVDKLLTLVEFFAKTGSPPLIILNIGTTFKGAYDDVEKVGRCLIPMLKKYGLDERTVACDANKRTGYWIHVDGALGASYLPYLQKAGGDIKENIPKFDFSLPYVHSIVTSAHKYPGCPMPSGIYMTKRKYQIAPPSNPEYIGSQDTTFAGSRNAISPAVLWCYYSSTGDKNETNKAIQVERTAKYAEKKLRELDEEFQKDGHNLWVKRTPLALTVRFRDPEEATIIFKYSLSQMSLKYNGESTPRKYVHIFIMQSVKEEKIDQLIKDLRSAYKKLFLEQKKVVEQPMPVSTVNENPHIQRVAFVPLDGRGFL